MSADRYTVEPAAPIKGGRKKERKKERKPKGGGGGGHFSAIPLLSFVSFRVAYHCMIAMVECQLARCPTFDEINFASER